ncbi:MAG: hypothetical protein JWM09_1082 [Francisellaceae bacterium]|nr:hypothetical protein [Francisellaceae bacterium]
MKLCPCGSQNQYLACCGKFLQKSLWPSEPETLMRSRYTAFCEGKLDYIKKTMKGLALKNHVKKHEAKKLKWLKLKVIKSWIEPSNPALGFVIFNAFYQQDGLTGVLSEKSEFHLIDNRWYYVDGEALEE